jgi:hypothetical protein
VVVGGLDWAGRGGAEHAVTGQLVRVADRLERGGLSGTGGPDDQVEAVTTGSADAVDRVALEREARRIYAFAGISHYAYTGNPSRSRRVGSDNKAGRRYGWTAQDRSGPPT